MTSPKITLRHIDGRKFSVLQGFTDPVSNKWDAISNRCSEEFECDADDVSLIEDDDGVEMISVEGKLVGFITDEFNRWPESFYRLPVAAE